jgi:hypothetical protein
MNMETPAEVDPAGVCLLLPSLPAIVELHHVSRLRALGAALNGELHPLALFQVAESLTLDGRVVDEDIIAVFALDEAIAFGTAEPLDRADGSFSHCLVHLLPLDTVK